MSIVSPQLVSPINNVIELGVLFISCLFFIPNNLPPMLERLQIDPKHWLYMTQHFGSRFKGLVGTVHSLKVACKKLGYRRTPNLSVCQRFLM
ncbi:MAG: hypothetical protein LC540_13515 [Candidatus Thiodiazotropha sp.]|nr:hypothetical protein [Candidatus Thiodiazotropha sp.]